MIAPIAPIAPADRPDPLGNPSQCWIVVEREKSAK